MSQDSRNKRNKLVGRGERRETEKESVVRGDGPRLLWLCFMEEKNKLVVLAKELTCKRKKLFAIKHSSACFYISKPL